MSVRYAHTNIIASDWKRLSIFYQEVFYCVPVPPQRKQAGEWLAKGTGVKNAALEGVHLLLPGYGTSGPTLEIYQFSEMVGLPEPAANHKGYRHIAFQVDDVSRTLALALEHGAQKVGEITHKRVEGVGELTFIYISDPEGNIIELQKWA